MKDFETVIEVFSFAMVFGLVKAQHFVLNAGHFFLRKERSSSCVLLLLIKFANLAILGID